MSFELIYSAFRLN